MGLAAHASAQQPPVNAETVYKDTCATCHDNPQGRTPSRAALKDRSAEAILLALTTGSMNMQAINLTVAEKRAVAELLSGRSLGATGLDANACKTQETRLGAFTTRPQWNGFGADATNSRFQQESRSHRGGRAESEIEMGVRIPWRLASLRQSGDRRRANLRGQRHRQVLLARCADRLYLLVVPGRRRHSVGAER
jgi:hypothetical protein